jgi:NADH:ubiquinone oxidoreductase subunit 6 (subunit J)
MGIELIIFLLVGILSIFSAVMMLISNNAVHAALFLILNFATVAFMYLMLHAPFLALVQITVYAGAIMVLFLFVIMLMGAERILPKPTPQYNWLAPAAVGVVVTILLISSILILEAQIDDTEIEPDTPLVRVVHSDSLLEIETDVYLDDELLVSEFGFSEQSTFGEVDAGEYVLRVVPHGEAADTDPLLAEPVLVEPGEVLSLVILPEAINGSKVLSVNETLDAVDNRGEARLTVVHAANCPDGCTFDLADNTQPDKTPLVFAENVAYGTVAEVFTMRRDRYGGHEYTLGAFTAGEIEDARGGEEDTSDDVAPVVSRSAFEVRDNHNYLWVITSDNRAQEFRYRQVFTEVESVPGFGSARGIGQLLFTDYLLPFEMIAILLLVAMIGVIILTKELEDQEKPRRRTVRRMANVPGNPTVEEYMESVESGQPLPPPSAPNQLPESTGD